MREAARGLSRLFQPDLILTSPYLRARQTADILEREYNTGAVRLCHALASGDNTELLADIEASPVRRILLVGHEPHISGSTSLLVSGATDGMPLSFKKGAAALVSFDERPEPGRGLLEWLLQPAALRGLAR